MKQTILTILLVLCLPLGGLGDQTGTTAQAASKTVTYTFTGEYDERNVNCWTLTFTPSNSGFGYSTGEKTATIQNTTSTTGFTVNLDDGLKLTYSQDEGRLTFWGFNGFYLNHSSNGGNSCLTLTSSHYYVTHVKMATTSGSTLTGQASPWMTASGELDQDVDMVTQYDGLGSYRSFSATFTAAQVFGQLTVTYGDPREYAITYNNAVNGQKGVTNTNPTSYNVTTNTFQITAPTRTGYTLSGTTYTDAAHTSATAVNLSQSPLRINRGEAVTRKAITFNTSWTAHQYTLRLHHNDGTDNYDDVAMTYDVAQTLASVTRTGYVLSGWNTQADGSGTSYNDGESVTNLTAEQDAVIDLYAQWANPSGTCGDNATWEYDHATRTLTIGGSGEITSSPWRNDYKDYIETVSIGSGITEINGYVFYNYSALANVTGGEGLTYVSTDAFYGTPWRTAAEANTTTVTYLGHIAYIGRGVSGDVTIQDGTFSIAKDAFNRNTAITSVTIPDGVTDINQYAFKNCTALATVNVLTATPPMLYTEAFSLDTRSLARTINVRSASYKTADDWADIYNKVDDYTGYTGTELRVVSTLALPDGVTASANDDDKVTAYGTDYYAEGTSVTLSYTGSAALEGIKVNGSSDGITNNGNGTFTFTMPAEDVIVTRQCTPVSYIDADGNEQTCTDYTIIESSTGNVTLGNSANNEAWYVVPASEVTISYNLRMNDKAIHLILCDGAELNVRGINCNFGSLTIYGQTQQNGKLTATSQGGNALDVQNGDLTVNGGNIIATSANYAGIQVSGANVIINRGSVTATSNDTNHSGFTVGSAGKYIDDNLVWIGGDVTINGGNVSATGGGDGIYAEGTITLGWTNPEDRIYASSYRADSGISVKSGQALTDGTDTYFGTINANAIAGKTLQPADLTTNMTISLAGGWNWVSFYVETDLDNLKDQLVTATNGASPIIINSQTNGCAVYDGTNWKGTLSSLDMSQMYQIKLTEDCVLHIEGDLINPSDHPATIIRGYNWIGFPSSESMSVRDAFAGFAVAGDDLFSKDSYTDHGRLGWRGDLKTLNPGEGYIYRSDKREERTLIFPSYSRALNGSRSAIHESHWPDFEDHKYKLNQPVVASIRINNQTITSADSWEELEVAAFVGDECRGHAFMRYDSEEFGDRNPVVELPVYYTTSDEEVTFKLYVHANGIEYDMGTLNNGGTIYTGQEHVEFYTSSNGNDWISLNFVSGTPVEITLANGTDNTSVIEGNKYAYANVTLQDRTLYKDGSWNTLCLPFDLTISGSTLDGNGVDVRTLSTSDFTGGTLKLTFTNEGAVSTIEAGKPYLIRWSKPDGYDGHEEDFDITDPVFTGVTVTKATTPVETQYVDFIGTFSPQLIYESAEKHNLYLGDGNTLYYPTATDFKVNSFRAYFQLKGGLTCGTPSGDDTPGEGGQFVRAFNLSFGDEESQGIKEIEDGRLKIENETGAVYDLQGRRVESSIFHSQSSIKKRGLYIQNGKKVVIP